MLPLSGPELRFWVVKAPKKPGIARSALRTSQSRVFRAHGHTPAPISVRRLYAAAVNA